MKNRNEIQKEALDVLNKHNRCGLNISMGVGKTRIAINHMIDNYNAYIKYLIVIPKNSIKQSWLDEFEKMNHNLSEHIEFTTYLSLNKKNPEDYDIVYLDECHSLKEKHEEFLSAFKGSIIGLTGTAPVRQGNEKYYMVNKYCPIKYNFTVDDATNNNILNDYKIIVHYLKLSTKNNIKKKGKFGDWYTSELDDYKYNTSKVAQSFKKQWPSIMRMTALKTYETKIDYAKKLLEKIDTKCILFANTQQQADKTCDYSYHSKNIQSKDNLELFIKGKINKLSCVEQLSEGVSIPDLEAGIIMHAYGNNRKSAQRIGRLLRLSPNKTATCHILCYKDTIDEEWIQSALKEFDTDKILHVEVKD